VSDSGPEQPATPLVVLGASAGGVEALSTVVGGLPADLPAALVVVLHVAPTHPSRLPEILSRAGTLPAMHAINGDELVDGRVYVAPPDRHVLVDRSRLRVVRGPRENGLRPAADPLFQSAANAYGESVVAVVLSGTRDDGAAGACAVSRRNGTVVVQDPEDATFPDMPLNTIALDHPDYVLPLDEIPGTVARLVASLPAAAAISDDRPEDDPMLLETKYAALDRAVLQREEGIGERSAFACPECGGELWMTNNGNAEHFRCRVGHAYGSGSLLAAQSDSLDAALWTALRALEERSSLSRRIATRFRARDMNLAAQRHDEIVRESERHALVIRNVLLGRDAREA